MSYLSYDNPNTMSGNNPYQQNRMTIDPRYRMAQGSAADLTKVQGYSATGEVLYKGDAGIASAQNTQSAQAAQTWANLRKPQQELSAHNQELMDNISQIKALQGQAPQVQQVQMQVKAPALPSWRESIQNPNQSHNQSQLRQFNDQRYQQIMKENRNTKN